VGYVESAATAITMITQTSDQVGQVGSITTLTAPAATPAVNVITTIVVSTNFYAGATGSVVDITFTLGAPMTSSDVLLISFSSGAELLRSDSGSIGC
jgi:hypothetical protein